MLRGVCPRGTRDLVRPVSRPARRFSAFAVPRHRNVARHGPRKTRINVNWSNLPLRPRVVRIKHPRRCILATV